MLFEITQQETHISKNSCCNRCRKNVTVRTEFLHGLPPNRGPLFDPYNQISLPDNTVNNDDKNNRKFSVVN